MIDLFPSLAYRPILDPMPVDGHWVLLLFPLVLAISVVIKAIRLDDLTKLPRQAVVLAVQIVVFMVLAALVLWALTELA